MSAGSSRERPAAPTRVVLNREYIAAIALAVIDETGLNGFSMRKLGAALGADPMAAYRHYADQQDLFDGIAAVMFDELELENLPWQADWREMMRTYAHRLRSILTRHPHAVSIFATRPARSITAIDIGNRMITQLTASGFAPATALQLSRCLREFAIGHILSRTTGAAAGERSRKPAPDSPDYNGLAAAADAASGDYFDIGLTAMFDGFGRNVG
ncbi:TetR/AcrR family transcriptional regulator C-terminal domain-containing protein [Nocardia sp. NBC_00565]|uniref:TetR/AcrR family transcriptional regulator C-terminal domain-containing protein n=1 Tax=Nocardia sp. NBC_00565 TaxID=2975993 RepID=UPI002E815097|nr:TetR/AcrR family transcriptional regulator C-terminal domain-containing protein [Nocardia sp. NBC_00565]WUB99805.1 TetR/AcrR family transcriptional regulator C-terminal domain-containing protein [Nocardia sp. NBC_00565]